MGRTIIIIALALIGACSMAEEFDGEPCGVDKDCWHTQECARTDAERQADLPGICTDKGTGCLAGEQLGCSCAPEDPLLDCSAPAASPVTDYPELMCDATMLVCVLATQEATTEG